MVGQSGPVPCYPRQSSVSSLFVVFAVVFMCAVWVWRLAARAHESCYSMRGGNVSFSCSLSNTVSSSPSDGPLENRRPGSANGSHGRPSCRASRRVAGTAPAKGPSCEQGQLHDNDVRPRPDAATPKSRGNKGGASNQLLSTALNAKLPAFLLSCPSDGAHYLDSFCFRRGGRVLFYARLAGSSREKNKDEADFFFFYFGGRKTERGLPLWEVS